MYICTCCFANFNKENIFLIDIIVIIVIVISPPTSRARLYYTIIPCKGSIEQAMGSSFGRSLDDDVTVQHPGEEDLNALHDMFDLSSVTSTL